MVAYPRQSINFSRLGNFRLFRTSKNKNLKVGRQAPFFVCMSHVQAGQIAPLGVFSLYLVITQKLTFMKSGGFHVKSTYKTYKSNISRKTLQFYGVLWEVYIMFSHEIRQISRNPPDFERPIARNGKPYVL